MQKQKQPRNLLIIPIIFQSETSDEVRLKSELCTKNILSVCNNYKQRQNSGFCTIAFHFQEWRFGFFFDGLGEEKRKAKVFPDKERLLTFSVTTLYIFLKMEIRIHHALNI